jgi:pSer/pThr/pTyr-binding forkhead associated (FHA) protein
VLYTRSKEGTLVNDSPVTGSVMLRAGDWIRLGARGPVVRFLGHHGLLPA